MNTVVDGDVNMKCENGEVNDKITENINSEIIGEVKNEITEEINGELNVEISESTKGECMGEHSEAKDKTEDNNATLVPPSEESCKNVGDPPTDEYHYLKTGVFTSEMFKVCVKNIPARVSYGCFSSCMKSFLGFKPRKVKFNPSNSYAFLAFSNEEEREKALNILDNRVWKKTTLSCKKAAPAKDPFVRELKRKQKFQEEHSKKQKLSDDDTDLSPEERIVRAVCPYASKTYEEQLALKEREIRSCMERLSHVMRQDKIGSTWMNKRKDNLCLDLLPIVKSPILNYYRNKVEFTIGKGTDGKDNIVGFRLGSYREGSLTIVEPSKCINCSLKSIQIGKEFQQFIQSLPHPSFNVSTHIGFWQQLTVRTCTTDDVMVIIQIQPHYLSKEDFEGVQQMLVDFFTSVERSVKVSSVYLSSSSQRNNTIDTFNFLAGNHHITEKLLGLHFRISPDAFFQVNTPGAEILYRTIHEWCDTNQEDACVLDVCCGTGTIGLCIANGTSCEVTGIEISEQAVQDARFNAEFNGVKNANFVCGPAEEVIGATVKKIKNKNVIAVVDPPRAGLRRNVIQTLRACSAIKKIIYVSCSPKQAVDNFLSFCRPESKRFQGVPFKTVRAIPVDLFPHTSHCELIVELERVDYLPNIKSDHEEKAQVALGDTKEVATGDTEGDTDGVAVGDTEECTVEVATGDAVGDTIGDTEGDTIGDMGEVAMNTVDNKQLTSNLETQLTVDNSDNIQVEDGKVGSDIKTE